MSERTKRLLELRAKTDHDLLVLVNHDLELGLALLDGAATRKAPGFIKAYERYKTARRLLPVISIPSEFERARIELNLSEVRARLTRVPSGSDARVFPFAC